MEPICTGYGSSDTHAVHLSNGTRNPHPSAGTPYSTIDIVTLWAMVQDPPATSKAQAQWIIPSGYNGSDARSHAAQRAQGRFHYLAVDVDKGSPSLQAVQAAVALCLGEGVTALFYATASCAPGNRKWRALIPLGETLTGLEYSAYQAALFDALEAQGIQCDGSLERPGQLVYLPNRGDHYEWAVQGHTPLLPRSHPMAQRAGQYLAMAQAGSTQNAARSGPRSPIAAFLRKHPLEQLLMGYGFIQSPNGRSQWRSPYQSGTSYATQVFEDRTWFSLSYSDRDAGMGARTVNGVYGDGFDLYVHFTCGGDTAAAMAYAKQCFEEEENARMGAATAEHGRSLIQAMQAAAVARAEERASGVDIKLADDEGNNEEWDIPWPPGLAGELAKWIYATSPRPIKQFSIAMSIFFLTAGARKFTVSGSHPVLSLMLVAETGRGKGVVKRRLDAFCEFVVKHRANPELTRPFSHELSLSNSGFRRALSEQNPLCMYQEELGSELARMVKDSASENMKGLKDAMTRAYDAGSLGVKQASSSENTKAAVHRACATIAGDTQPDTYRKLLSESAIESGFAPRLIPFFYTGQRPYRSTVPDHMLQPPQHLLEWASSFLEYALTTGEHIVQVAIDQETQRAIEQLDKVNTDLINTNAPGVQLANRMDESILRVSGLLAVSINHLQPVITMDLFRYARKVVEAGNSFSRKLVSLGAGQEGAPARELHVRRAVEDFMRLTPEQKAGYKVPVTVRPIKGVFNLRFLVDKLKHKADFKPHGNATSRSIVQAAVDEMLQDDVLELYQDVTRANVGPLYVIGKNW